ncbi:MAG: heavy metal translocating P-type ATPase [Coraliomargarita sp.]
MSEIKSTSSRPAVVCTTEDQACDDLDVKLSKSWLRIAIAAVFAGQGMMLSLALSMTPPEFGTPVYWVLHGGLIFATLIVMLFLGGPLFGSTFGMLRSKRLSIEGLFTLSLLGAFIGSLVSTFTGAGAVFYEVVSIVIAIYTLGRMLSERSQAKLRMESDRVREFYDTACVLVDGQWVEMPVAEVTSGSRVRVAPGEPFSVDGRVVSGVGYVKETALTGEPLPVVRHVGDLVRAGTWSEDGRFEVEVTAALGARELDGILQTVEDVSGRPSELQSQANDLIQGFLPLVAGVSIATAIYWSFMGTWIDAVLNSMAVLLVACPCALGLATPVAIWQGLFQLSRSGLVSRDGALIDVLAQTRQLFFDKTGTLSESAMRVTECLVLPEWEAHREELLGAVGAVESQLKHPIARALSVYIGSAESEVSELQLVAGKGVRAEVQLDGAGVELRIGEFELGGGAEPYDLGLKAQGGKRVFVFVGESLAAVFVLHERLREGVPDIWQALAEHGIKAAVLTGDPNPEIELPHGVEIQSGLSAAEKSEIVSKSNDAGEYPILIGDGINDAGAMASASASIAMGSGTGLTRTTASGQLISDRLEALIEAMALARMIRKRLRGNLIYAAAYNVLGMGLAAAGLLHPVVAALIMLISSAWVTARALQIRLPDKIN